MPVTESMSKLAKLVVCAEQKTGIKKEQMIKNFILGNRLQDMEVTTMGRRRNRTKKIVDALWCIHLELQALQKGFC